MKRDPRLVGLSHDHHSALVLGTQLSRSPQGARVDALRALFIDNIEPHFAIEEALLLPALARLQTPEADALIARTQADHAWLRARFADLQQGQPIDLAEYGERLAAHVRFEERELFEYSQTHLPDSVLAKIADARPVAPATGGR